MGFFSTWLQKLHETFIETQYWKLMLEGFGNTIVITLGALLIGVLIGTLIAVIKYCAEGTKALKPLAWICDLYVTVIRGVPVVVLLLIFYFIIMTSAEGITVGILTFGINSGAYMAELIRGGINSVDRGQMEAGRSLGLNYSITMRFVVVPQAIKNILPALGNEFITLLKDTSLITVIGGKEMLYAAQAIYAKTYAPMMPLVGTAILRAADPAAFYQSLERGGGRRCRF